MRQFWQSKKQFIYLLFYCICLFNLQFIFSLKVDVFSITFIWNVYGKPKSYRTYFLLHYIYLFNLHIFFWILSNFFDLTHSHGRADLLKMVDVEILPNFRNFKEDFENFICNRVSSLLSTHYSTFLFTGPVDLAKAKSL